MKENMSESSTAEAPAAADLGGDPAPLPETSREPGSIRERMEEIAERIEKREAGGEEGESEKAESEAPAKPAAARDPAGKFAPKNAPAEAAGAEKSAPPAWLTGKAAVDWNRLPPSVREALASAVPPAPAAAAPAPVQQQPAPADPIREIVTQYADHFTQRGIAPEHGVASLLQTYRQLEQNPAETLRFLAGQYGVPWGGDQPSQQRGNPMAPQEGQPYQQPDIDSHPRFVALQNKLNALEQGYGTVQQRIAAQDREAAARRVHEASMTIERFVNDPDHPRPHFDAVREDMARLMNAKLATDIADAYDKAVWANPQVRATMMAEAQAKAAEEAAKAAREREAAAKRAALINARTAGTAAIAANGTRSIRDTMERIASTIE